MSVLQFGAEIYVMALNIGIPVLFVILLGYLLFTNRKQSERIAELENQIQDSKKGDEE